MPLKNGIYILECIPKKESLGEGAMIKEFLKIIMPADRVELKPIKDGNDFFDKLNNNNSRIVHISCHGNQNEDGDFYIATPDGGGVLSESFFESDHLRGRDVVITGCFLGRKEFADEFLNRTQAESLIAPVKIIDSFDVAMWCANFYYHLLRKNLTFVECYDYMKETFYVPGAIKMWGWKE